MKKMNKKGFTLIEMLVVIAIIAILVSIVIPVVGSATEKAKEAADAANIRSAIATVTTAGLAGDTANYTATVTTTQSGAFEKNEDLDTIGGFDIDDFNCAAGSTISVVYDEDTQAVTVSVNGAAIS